MTMILDGSAGMTAPQGAIYNGLQKATAVGASGTSIDFTNIPSWVQRVTVLFAGVSLNGSDDILVQIGSGSFTTSGYVSSSGAVRDGTTSIVSSSTSGFIVRVQDTARTVSGLMTITQLSANIWVSNYTVKIDSSIVIVGAGDISFAGAIDRVRITRTGTNTFDAGNINIMYE
jgi:hypothetical protein